MSNKTTFEVTGIAKLDVSQVKSSAEQMKSYLEGMTLPSGIDKNLSSIFRRLNDEIAEFEVKNKKAVTNADWSDVIKSGERILNLYDKMEGQISQIIDLSDDQMSTLFPKEVTQNIEAAKKALDQYDEELKESIALQERSLKSAKGKASKAKQGLESHKGKTVVSDAEYKARSTAASRAVEAQLVDEESVRKAEQALKDYTTTYLAAKPNGRPTTTKEYDQLSSQLETAKGKLNETKAAADQATSALSGIVKESTINKLTADLNMAEAEANEAAEAIEGLKSGGDPAALDTLIKALHELDGIELGDEVQDVEAIKRAVETYKASKVKEVKTQIEGLSPELDKVAKSAKNFKGGLQEGTSAMHDMTSMQGQIESLKNSFLHFFSLTNGWMLLRRGICSAYEAVKELDDAMTEIAVVSEYTLDDIWAKRDEYTKAASDMGASTLDLVNATKLYVQQGMDLNEAQEVGIETTKMARIANLDGADATNLMTAALRGFNMEMNEANRVNDVYSQLAAKSAADTKEIATAMSKTASIAANAGASFENTSAFLTQIIETTREAPETAGTALKTIIARFQELKKAPSEIGEVDGETVDANAIETALKTAGVELRNAQGEFRNFDDVIMELSGKWNSLDLMTQRYIATMAAGSRQQSRFIALMSDNARLTELTGYAANSAGAANEQFSDTLDSLEAKVNRLKNAWSLYLQNLANNKVIKGVIDVLTMLLEAINNITASMPSFTGSVLQAILTFVAFRAASTLITKAFASLGPILYKSGQQAGATYSAGVKTGVLKGQAGIKGALKKIKALFAREKWIGKGYIIKFKADPKALAPYTNAMKAVNAAQAKYNITAASTTATNKAKKKSENELTAALASRNVALKAMGISEAEYNTLQGLGLTQDQMDIALTNKEVRAKLLDIAATKGMSDADKEAAISQALVNKQQQMGLLTKARYLIALLFTGAKTREEAGATLAAAGAMGIKSKADVAATASQWSLNAAIYACPLGWILVIILAVVAALVLLAVAMDNAFESDAERMKRLEQEAEAAKKSCEKTKEAYEELRDEIDNYKDLTNNLDNLQEGTAEWCDQLMAVNDQVMKLIELFPQLQNYLVVGDDGRLSLQGEGLAEAQRLMTQAVYFSTVASTQADIALLQERQKQAYKNTLDINDINYIALQAEKYDSGDFDEEFQAALIKKWGTIEGNSQIRAAFASKQLEYAGAGNVRYDENTHEYVYKDVEGNEHSENEAYVALDSVYFASDEMNELGQELGVNSGLLWEMRDSILAWLENVSEIEKEIEIKARLLGTQMMQGIQIAEVHKEGFATALGTVYTDYYDVIESIEDNATQMNKVGNSGNDNTAGLRAYFNLGDEGSQRKNLEALYQHVYQQTPDEEMTDDELRVAVNNAVKTQVVQKEIQAVQEAMYTDAVLTDIITLNLDATDIDYTNEGKTYTGLAKAMMDANIEKIKEQRASIEQFVVTHAIGNGYGISAEAAEKYNELMSSPTVVAAKAEYEKYKAMDKDALRAEYLESSGKETATDEDLEKYRKKKMDAAQKTVLGLTEKWATAAAHNYIQQFSYTAMKGAEQAMSDIVANFANGGEKVLADFLFASDDVEVVAERLKIMEEVDFSSPIAAAKSLREMVASTDETVVQLAKDLEDYDDNFTNLTSQFNELVSSISTNTLAELNEDGKITYDEVQALAKSMPKLRDMLEDTTISVSGLGKALTKYQSGVIKSTDLTENYIRVLMRLEGMQNVIDDAFGFLDTFEADRSTTEIGQYFAEVRESILTAYERGQYNDPQTVSYIKAIVGEKAWEEALGTTKDKIEKFLPIVESLSENFYSFWQLPGGAEDNFITKLADGSLQMDLSMFRNMDELLAHIQKAYGVTKDVANAALADFKTYSDGFEQSIKTLEQLGALQALVEGAFYSKSSGQYIIDGQQLQQIAEALDITYKELQDIILEENKGKTITFTAVLDEKNNITDEWAKSILEQVTAGDTASLETAIQGAYTLLLELGIDDENAKAQIGALFSNSNKMFSDSNFGFNEKQLTDALTILSAGTSNAIVSGVGSEESSLAVTYLAAETEYSMYKATLVALTDAFKAGLLMLGNLTIEETTVKLKKDGKTAKKHGKTKTTTGIGGLEEAAKAMGEYVDGLLKEADEKHNNNDLGGQDLKFDIEAIQKQLEKWLKGIGYGNENSQLGPGGSFDKEADEWEEDYDWLHNYTKKLEKQMRERDRLESEYNKMLEDRNTTTTQLSQQLDKIEANEAAQLSNLNYQKNQRLKVELKELLAEYSDVGKYIGWDSANQMVTVNEKLSSGQLDGKISPEVGERIDEAYDKLSELQGQLEDIDDDVLDIEEGQRERLKQQLEQYASLEERLYDAIVDEREKEIEALEELNDVVSEANEELLDKIQTGIDDSRQAREDEEAMEDISEMEQRLAMMRTDTSGANALDILSLEEELEQARQDFMDNKIDQAIDQLSRQNEEAQKQREKQIEVMQWQLEQDQENGNIAQRVNEMLAAFVGSGDTKSIEEKLKNKDLWAGMTAQQREDWVIELRNTIAESQEGWRTANAVSKTAATGEQVTFLDKNGATLTGQVQADGRVKVGNNYYSDVFKDATGNYRQFMGGTVEYKAPTPAPSNNAQQQQPQQKQEPAGEKVTSAIKKRVSDTIWNGATKWGWGSGKERKDKLTSIFGKVHAGEIQDLVNQGKTFYSNTNYSDYSYSALKNRKFQKYETGGLASFTGPAWLDGTAARPEYVLNAEQTQGFLALVDMLGDFSDNPTAGGNNYYDVHIEVDEVSNDYDVEQMMDKMKRVITDDAMYRNVNAIDLGRR